MNEPHLLIFDLDGTLIDSKLDLANAVNASRGFLGLGPISNELVYSYVGNGAPMLIRRAIGTEASDAGVAMALEYFLKYYGEHALDETRLYPGVREALDQFRDAGTRLAVLTNKPVRISERIVAGLDLGSHFFRVFGGNSFDQKKPDPVGILALMEESEIPRDRTVMVGDSSVDILTARNAQVRACGVRYGFQPESLREVPPDYLVDDLRELASHLLLR